MSSTLPWLFFLKLYLLVYQANFFSIITFSATPLWGSVVSVLVQLSRYKTEWFLIIKRSAPTTQVTSSIFSFFFHFSIFFFLSVVQQAAGLGWYYPLSDNNTLATTAFLLTNILCVVYYVSLLNYEPNRSRLGFNVPTTYNTVQDPMLFETCTFPGSWHKKAACRIKMCFFN